MTLPFFKWTTRKLSFMGVFFFFIRWCCRLHTFGLPNCVLLALFSSLLQISSHQMDIHWMRAAACTQGFKSAGADISTVHMRTSQSIFWALVYHPPSALCANNNQAVALHLFDLQKGLVEWNNPLSDRLTWDKGFIFWICSPMAVSTNQPGQSNLFFFFFSGALSPSSTRSTIQFLTYFLI